MIDISEDTYLSLNECVSIVKDREGGAILFNPDNSIEKRINPTGFMTLEALIPGDTVKNVSKQLNGIFTDVEEHQVLADLIVFYSELVRCGYVNREPKNGSNRYPPHFPSIDDAPRIVDVAITGKCNLNCPFCFYSDDMQGRQDISLDEWVTFFYELHRSGVRQVILSGGEVFLRKDLFEILNHIVEIGLRFSLLSNGTLINDQMIGRLNRNYYLKRLDSIQISIDGSCPEVHDAIRGKGSFQKSIEGLRLLIKNNFPVTVRVTVNRANIYDLENIAKLLLVTMKLPGFTVNDALPIGAACRTNADITLTGKQQYEAMKILANIEKLYDGRVQASAGPLARWHCFQEMEKARAQGKPKSGMGFLSSCGCAFIKLAVHHDGTIAPCNMLTGLTLGKINKDSFSEVWKNHPILKDLRDRRKIPLAKTPGCKECEWSDFCKGGCPVTVFHETRDFNRANSGDCYKMFLKENNGRKPWLENDGD